MISQIFENVVETDSKSRRRPIVKIRQTAINTFVNWRVIFGDEVINSHQHRRRAQLSWPGKRMEQVMPDNPALTRWFRSPYVGVVSFKVRKQISSKFFLNDNCGIFEFCRLNVLVVELSLFIFVDYVFSILNLFEKSHKVIWMMISKRTKYPVRCLKHLCLFGFMPTVISTYLRSLRILALLKI